MASRYDDLVPAWESSSKIRRRIVKSGELVIFPKSDKEGQHPTSTAALELNAPALCIMVEKLQTPAKRVPVKLLEAAVPY